MANGQEDHGRVRIIDNLERALHEQQRQKGQPLRVSRETTLDVTDTLGTVNADLIVHNENCTTCSNSGEKDGMYQMVAVVHSPLLEKRDPAEDLRGIGAVNWILVICRDLLRVTSFRRDGDKWQMMGFAGPKASVNIGETSLSLQKLYDQVTLGHPSLPLRYWMAQTIREERAILLSSRTRGGLPPRRQTGLEEDAIRRFKRLVDRTDVESINYVAEAHAPWLDTTSLNEGGKTVFKDRLSQSTNLRSALKTDLLNWESEHRKLPRSAGTEPKPSRRYSFHDQILTVKAAW